MALLAVHVPEHGGEIAILEGGHAALHQALGDAVAMLAHLDHTGQVALDVRQEHRHAHIGEALSQDLQGHCLARAGRAGDQAVTVRHLRQQADGRFPGADPDFVFIQHMDCLLIIRLERN